MVGRVNKKQKSIMRYFQMAVAAAVSMAVYISGMTHKLTQIQCE